MPWTDTQKRQLYGRASEDNSGPSTRDRRHSRVSEERAQSPHGRRWSLFLNLSEDGDAFTAQAIPRQDAGRWERSMSWHQDPDLRMSVSQGLTAAQQEPVDICERRPLQILWPEQRLESNITVTLYSTS